LLQGEGEKAQDAITASSAARTLLLSEVVRKKLEKLNKNYQQSLTKKQGKAKQSKWHYYYCCCYYSQCAIGKKLIIIIIK